MDDNHTTLILGAGASKPYGFPLGSELIQSIASYKLGLDSERDSVLRRFGFTPKDVAHLASQLGRATYRSVEEFLEKEKDTEFDEMAKVLMAVTLLKCEAASRQLLENNRHWYTSLFDSLTHSCGNLHIENLSVITYNFDRSFEEFLFLYLQRRCGFSDNKAARMVQNLRLIHIHGSLGFHPVSLRENPFFDGGWFVPYGASPTFKYVQQAKEMMRLVKDYWHDDFPVFQDAREELYRASRIIFLGFGYHPLNVERLEMFGESFKHRAWRPELYGTAYGMAQKQRAIVLSRMFRDSIKLGRQSETIWNFVKRVGLFRPDRSKS